MGLPPAPRASSACARRNASTCRRGPWRTGWPPRRPRRRGSRRSRSCRRWGRGARAAPSARPRVRPAGPRCRRSRPASSRGRRPTTRRTSPWPPRGRRAPAGRRGTRSPPVRAACAASTPCAGRAGRQGRRGRPAGRARPRTPAPARRDGRARVQATDEALRPRDSLLLGGLLLGAPLAGAVATLEALDAATGVDQLLTPGEERVALVAELDVEVGLGGARGERVAARAADGRLDV